jgi:hypothetical protein
VAPELDDPAPELEPLEPEPELLEPELLEPEPELDPLEPELEPEPAGAPELEPELEEELDADASGTGAPEPEPLELDPAPPASGRGVVSSTAAPHAATKTGSATSAPKEWKERGETWRNFLMVDQTETRQPTETAHHSRRARVVHPPAEEGLTGRSEDQEGHEGSARQLSARLGRKGSCSLPQRRGED